MSGIAGIIHFDGAPVEPGLIEKMTTSMAHRGPDGIHHWVKGNVALGQCMLCTTPESLEERQPLTNEDESLVLVMDGRIDNWEELRLELLGRDVRLRDRSDAELMLRSYETWGEDCVTRIDGDFALVVWDARRRTAFCARDVFGVRPLYFHAEARTAVFATELQALFKFPAIPRTPNEGMVAEHLIACVTSRTETVFRGIGRLAPAHVLRLRPAGADSREYWCLDPHHEVRFPTEAGYVDTFRALLEDSVRRRLRRIGPVGSCLSGGLDSSTVSVTAASLLHREGRRDDLRTFSLIFPGKTYDESWFIGQTASFAGLAPALVPPVRYAAAFYRDQVTRYHTPPSSPNGEPMLGPLRAAAATSGCRVLLTGHGGNEWLQGSWFHLADLLAKGRLIDFYRTARADAVLWLGRDEFNWDLAVPYGISPLAPKWLRRAVRYWRRTDYPWLTTPYCRRSGILERVRQTEPGGRYRTYAQEGIVRSGLSGWQAHALEENDKEAAAHRIEERHPFFDRKLVEFLFAVPEELRVRGPRVKFILRQAMQGRLPQSALNRVTQAEFSDCLWAAMEEIDAMSLFEHSALQDRGWVHADVLRRRYQAGRREPGHGPWLFWAFVAMEYWARGALCGTGEETFKIAGQS